MTTDHVKPILGSLAKFPEQLREFISKFPASSYQLKPSENEFSLLEHLCHLRDLEEEAYGVRIQRMLSEDEPFLPDVDGGKLAQERNYQHQELHPALDRFCALRETNIAVLNALAPDQFDRRGEFEFVGHVTLAQLLEKIVEHDQAHWEELKNLNPTTV